MARWSARARVTHPGIEGPADPAAAAAAIQQQLAAQVSGWAVDDVGLRPVYAAGDWVRVERSTGRAEYARVVQGLTELQVEFADGTRRALRPEMTRV